MRVLHVVPSLLSESGGPSRIVPELCRALAIAGTDITLFSTHQLGKETTINPWQEPYEVRLFPAMDGSLGGAHQIYQAIRRRALEFDLIHITSLWNFTTTLTAAAARRTLVPYVIAPMGMLSEICLRQRNYALKRTYSWIYDRRTIEGASRLQLANEGELRTLHKRWFKYPKHFFARNGIDLGRASVKTGAFRARFPELRNRKIMLFLGRLHPIKGLNLQLQALERLIPKHPDLVWALVGPNGGEWERLKALTKSAGLEEHVKWIGPLMGEERFSALADADVVVQTSLYECQSMTVNEALAVGAPLAVTDSINYAEVQTSGAGYVVKRDAAELANAIESILSLADRGNSMRDAGRRFANEALSWPRIALHLNAQYMEVLGSAETQQVPNKTSKAASVFS